MSKRVYELFLFDIYIAILKINHVSDKFKDAESLKYDFISWDSVISNSTIRDTVSRLKRKVPEINIKNVINYGYVLKINLM